MPFIRIILPLCGTSGGPAGDTLHENKALNRHVGWHEGCNIKSMRKHSKQMKAAEIEMLTARVRTIAQAVVSSHAADRMAQKGVTGREIELCLQHGVPVEIHNEASELRVVVRFAYGKPKVAVCVVVGLETGTIATTWKNAGSDSHSTLNLWAYQWNVNVCSLLATA